MEVKSFVRSISDTQSSSEGLLPATHRLDLLIAEQRALVKSAQENLQQALNNFKKSSSKEEQESARMQVQSMLTRAQELVVTVQIILHIRSEISHIQKEIVEAKERHESTSKLHGRLQWLESHLEKMLLAKKRGRPGARGNRTQVLHPLSRHKESFVTDKSRRLGGRSEAFTGVQNQRDIVSLTNDTPNISEYDGLSISQRETPWKSESTGTSNSHTHTQIRSLISSKHSASRDSDDWHSESEANWTMIDAYSNQPKDITQSQVLSEDEKIMGQAYSPSWTKSKVTSTHKASHLRQIPSKQISDLESANPLKKENESSGLLPSLLSSSTESGNDSHLQETIHCFEAPRPVAVFGCCSWNSLVLAVNSNLVQSATDRTSSDLHEASKLMLYSAEMSDICNDIDSLKKLISNAGVAATHPGPLLSASKATVHFDLNSHPRSSVQNKRTLGNGRNDSESGNSVEVSKLPSIDDIPSECSRRSPSRKLQGKQAHNRSSTYPRYSSTWCNTINLSPVDQTQSQHRVKSASLLQSTLLRMRKNQAFGIDYKTDSALGTDDLFERSKFHEKHISQLISELDSPIVDVRKDSVQALGLLRQHRYRTEELLEKLERMMAADSHPLVRYEALKSLLSLGFVTDGVLNFVGCYLRQGSKTIVLDLLEYLCQDSVSLLLCEKPNDSEPSKSPMEVLHRDLLAMLKSADPSVKLLVAVLLSRGKLERESCIESLKCVLHESTPQSQSLALSCLTECWQFTDIDVVHSSLTQMKTFHDWRLRQKAVENLIHLDKQVLLLFVDEPGRTVYDYLMERLSNEPILYVRISIRRLLAHLGLEVKAKQYLMRKLESKSETMRSEAIIGWSAFDLKSERNIQTLLDCLELDPSTYVRVLVVRLFSNMKHCSSKVLTLLIEKSGGKGPVSKECLAALEKISKSQIIKKKELN